MVSKAPHLWQTSFNLYQWLMIVVHGYRATAVVLSLLLNIVVQTGKSIFFYLPSNRERSPKNVTLSYLIAFSLSLAIYYTSRIHKRNCSFLSVLFISSSLYLPSELFFVPCEITFTLFLIFIIKLFDVQRNVITLPFFRRFFFSFVPTFV